MWLHMGIVSDVEQGLSSGGIYVHSRPASRNSQVTSTFSVAHGLDYMPGGLDESRQ